MAKSSAHIAPGGSGYFAHNSRESFSKSQVFFDEKNELWNTKKEAFKLYRSELAARSDAYTKRTRQKLQKKTVTHLSTIINLEKHHTLKDLKPLVAWIETQLDSKVLQVAIHRDEGKLVHRETGETLTSGEHFFANPLDKKLYFDADYKDPVPMQEYALEKNYHAHIELMGISSEGKSIRGKFSNYFFRKLQDKTAEVLGMERGKRSQNYTKEQMKTIRDGMPQKSEFKNEKAYGQAFTKRAKELGIFIENKRAKRKDTHEYKQSKAKENEANAKILARVKDVDIENARLRARLKAEGAKRAEYSELEALIRKLKAEARAKDLTIDSLQEQITDYNALKTLLAKKEVALDTKDAQIANLSDKLEKTEEALENAVNLIEKFLKLENIKSRDRKQINEEVDKMLRERENNKEREGYQITDEELRQQIAETKAKVAQRTGKVRSTDKSQGYER